MIEIISFWALRRITSFRNPPYLSWLRAVGPARRTAHLTLQRPQPGSTYISGGRSKLTEALIDEAGPGRVDADVEYMREEIEREETEATARGSNLKESVGIWAYRVV